MKEFFEIILNGLEPVMFLALLFYAYLGLLTHIIVDIMYRKPLSEPSPVEFDIHYWWKDNKRRILSSIILVIIAVLTSSAFSNNPISMEVAFLLGLSGDIASLILKKKNIIKGYYSE